MKDTMSTIDVNALDRKQAVANAKAESELSDLKQHAMKMLRDFEEFNDHSSNRAIWELVQNACDLTTECEITIDYRNSKFSFSHNGRPFNSNSLVSLIKQVSGDKDENSEIPPVGKYGTGFLTTHSLGRKFSIDSLLESSGYYIEVNDFLVDRSAKRWEDLVEKIKEQKARVFDIIETGAIVDNPIFNTTFTYHPETAQEKKYVKDSFLDIEAYVPLVLTINNRIKKFRILSESGTEVSFSLSEKKSLSQTKRMELFQTTISKNMVDEIIYSVVDDENGIEIILPIDKNGNLKTFSERLARLFLYYPLVGSEDFGMNFIINCTGFLPAEERDTIHLKSNKDQLKDQEAINRDLVEKATELIFRFLNSNLLAVSNPLLYAEVDFSRNSGDEILDGYFVELQQTWVEEFKKLEIVECASGYKTVDEVVFLHPDLLLDENSFDAIYYQLSKLERDFPKKETIKDWSRFVFDWGYEQAIFVTDVDFVNNIQQMSLSDFDLSLLTCYYKYLLEGTGRAFFSSHLLLPNLNGDFQEFSSLKRAHAIDEILISIGKDLMPDVIDELIDPDFVFDFTFSTFGRKEYSVSANNKASEVLSDLAFCLRLTDAEMKTKEPLDGFLPIDLDYLTTLVKYCRLHSTVDSTSKPARLMQLVSRYYGFDDKLIQLDGIGEDGNIDLRQVQKKVAKVFFNTLLLEEREWIEDNIQFLFDVIGCNEDRFKDVFSTSSIYPNQQFELCGIAELKKGNGLSDDIVNLYNKLSKRPIQSVLVVSMFNDFLKENEVVTDKVLSIFIEEGFFETDVRDINVHPFKEDILIIISKLRDPAYKLLFPRLDDNKASLMLEVVTNENTKDDIFSIVVLKEAQLKKLGEIVQLPNFEEILTRAQDVVQYDNEKRSDFRHKHEIGTYIERKIREKLNADLAGKILVDKDKFVDAEDIQGGQDIIITFEGKELHFIEIKSRWNIKSSVLLSKLQLEKASENADRFTLLAVDITKYLGASDRYKLEEKEILPLIKAVDGVGVFAEPLIERNLLAEKDLNAEIKLVDFRGLVSQDIINGGSSFETFVDVLVEELLVKIEKMSN